MRLEREPDEWVDSMAVRLTVGRHVLRVYRCLWSGPSVRHWPGVWFARVGPVTMTYWQEAA